MRMDNVGTEIQVSERLQGGLGEEGKAFSVVGIITLGGAVEKIAVEIFFSLDHQEAEGAFPRLPDGKRHFLSVPFHLEALDDPAEREVPLPRLPVQWEHHPDLDAERTEELGKGAGDVGQPARLGKGNGFGSQHGNFHGARIIAQDPKISR